MRRRKFIAVLGGAAVVAGDVPVVVWAQQVLARAPDEMPRVVLVTLGGQSDPAVRSPIGAFEQGMRAARWSAGVNMRLEYRWVGANNIAQRATEAAAEIVASKTAGAAVALAVQRATSTIPIVLAVVSDPIAQGLVSNLARPGRNITDWDGWQVAGPAQKDVAPHQSSRRDVQSNSFTR